MKKRLLSLLCALALCLSLLPGTALAADSVSYVEYSWNEERSTLTSETRSVSDYTTVTSSVTAWGTSGQTTWYVVSDNATNTGRSNITVSGTVNLILTSGKTLTLNGPNIFLQDSSAVLNIYGQAGNTGKLSITAGNSSGDAGINLNGGTLNIHGGTVTATGYTNSGSTSAPGIDVDTSTLTVYDGTVTATGGTASNSIGRGAGIRVISGGTVNIHGGTVTATGASFASTNDYPGAGIGGSGSGSNGETCGTVTITGGTVTATGGDGYQQRAAAGIGGGAGNSSSAGGGGNVIISGGTVTANGGKASRNDNVQAPGIGGAVYLSSSGGAGTFSTGTNGSAVITTTGGIQAGTSGCSAIIDNKVYGNVTLPDSQLSSKNLTVTNGATLTISGEKTLSSSITVNDGGTLTVSGTVTNSGTITVESGGTLTGTGTINNTDSGKVTGEGTNNTVTITYPSTVTVTSNQSNDTVGPNQEVTFTATVTGSDTVGTPTGTVQFKDNGNDLGTAQTLNNEGKATYTTSNLEIGEHKITAVYSGDGSYTAKTSSELTFTVVGDVASISIETQPKKMTYTTGETLDLSDLVITVHYVGSTYTQDIIWSEDSGITASPENGTELSASQHNGQPITITYGDKTATTGNLTVARANPQVTAPTAKTLTYDGTDQALVTAGGTTGGTMQYSLSEDGEYTEAIPTGIDAGQYTVYYKVVGNDDYNDVAAQSVSVTIAKANAQVTAAPQAVEALAFTGQPHALVTAGSAAGGTMQYSLSEDGEYTEAIPTGTDAGDYTVWYKVVGDNNHNDTTAQSVSVTIGKAAATVTTAPQAVTGLTYTGNPQALVTAGTAEGGEMQYSTDGSNYYTDIPTGTNAGDYSVWYKVVGDENHSDTDPMEVKITIAKATPAYTVPTVLTATYGDTLGDVTLPEGWAWDAPNTSVGNVGDNTFAAIFMPSDTVNYNTVTENLTVTVSAKNITGADITLGDALTYTGQQQTQQIASVTVDGMAVTTYEISGNTGTDADTYTLTISGTGNFTGTATKEWSIAKANYDESKTASGSVLAGSSGEVTLPAIPDGASYGTASYSGSDLTGLTVSGGKLSYTGGENITEGQEYTVTVPVTGATNYVDYDIIVTLTGTTKKVPTGVPTLSTTTITYGQSLSTITLSGSMLDGEETVAGTFTWDAPTTTPNAGSYEAQWTFTPDNGDLYVSVSGTTAITVNKATPTGTPKYTAITTSGKTLADAGLTTEGGTFSVPGTVAWEQADTTQVQANTAYTWKFTPTDSGNYNSISGSVTLYTVSSGGGGGGGSSSSNITTETTKNPDGTTTTTVTNKNTGTVTETTKFPDGSKEVIETKKDGTVTTTTTDTTGNKTQVVENTDGTKETTITNKDGSSSATTVDETGKTQAEVKLPAAVVEDAQGEAVTLPMPEVPVTTDQENAPTVTVDLPGGGSAKVEIPVEDVTPGTVAVIVKADGTEEVIKTSLTTENGVAVTLSDGDTVKVVDNSKTFEDVPATYWGAEAVDFATSRELFVGTSETTFAPDTAMTRAMIVTVLARFEGVDTTTGSTWYEAGQQWAMQNGVSDGSNMDASLTREQLVTMFYRYAQSKGYDTTQGGMAIREYADFEQISDYAAEAMTWAVNTGIINGTSSTTISPQGPATRAQVATILMRFIEGMA